MKRKRQLSFDNKKIIKTEAIEIKIGKSRNRDVEMYYNELSKEYRYINNLEDSPSPDKYLLTIKTIR
jgi:hypothetical protein